MSDQMEADDYIAQQDQRISSQERQLHKAKKDIARLSRERDELRRTGQALSNLLNAGRRYVDGRGFKGPELTAFDNALANADKEPGG